MEQNYTPLNIKNLYKSDDALLKTVLIVIAILTVIVVSIMFYVLIKKNSQSVQPIVIPTQAPQIPLIISPTILVFPTVMIATPSPTIQVSSLSATPIIPTPSQVQKQASSSSKLP